MVVYFSYKGEMCVSNIESFDWQDPSVDCLDESKHRRESELRQRCGQMLQSFCDETGVLVGCLWYLV